MGPHDHIITHLDKRPCGCIFTEFADGRKTYQPCVACGLMRAGHQLSMSATTRFPWRRRRFLLDAGNALCAVATTIARAANQMGAASKAVDEALKNAADEEIREDRPEGSHPGQNGD